MLFDPDVCFFKINRPSYNETVPRGKATDLTSIECNGTRCLVVDAVKGIKRKINLHEFSNIPELIYFRANAELPTESQMIGRKICESHLHFLLLDWPDRTKDQKRERKRQCVRESLCMLPHEGECPKEAQEASKRNVLWWLENHNQLIHIGTSTRMMQVNSSDGQKLIQSRTLPQPRRPLIDTDWPGAEWPQGDAETDYPEYGTDNNGNLNDDYISNGDTIRYHFSEIAKMISSTTFYSETEWSKLAKDTQRRKIALGRKIFKEMCDSMADNAGDVIMDSILGMYKRNMDGGCGEQILNAVGERLANSKNRRSRVEALATIIDVPYFSSYNVLLSIPGVTRYLIHQARLYARGGLDLDVKYQRVRYEDKAIEFFLSFVVRSNALLSVPWISNRATKSDGTKVDLDGTIRTQTYARIIRQYQRELEVQKKTKKESVSTGTAFAILKAVVPKMSTRKSCVDEFACLANEAWRQLNGMVNEAGKRGIMTTDEEGDLVRRLRLSKNFIECDLRNHIEISSTVIHHCANFALSDPSNRAYRSKCNHNHDQECTDCEQAHQTLSLLQTLLVKSKNELSQSDQYEVDRWLQLIVKCTKDLEAYIAHIIRGVISDSTKQDVMSRLKDGECLVTLDWAQKFLPTSAEESQSSFYAKTGISLHVSHAATVKAGEKYHHSLIHTIDGCVQDSNSVSAIFKHGLSILKQHGIHTVIMRSDNASCYKSAAIIGDIASLDSDLPSVPAIIYSESQLGKGPCDRTTSHCKRKVNEETNGLKNSRDAAEIFTALTAKDPIRGTSVYHCTIDGEEADSKKIPDISSIFDVRFENSNVITRKHSGIGPGITTGGLKQLRSSLTVVSEGGFLSDEKFWTPYGLAETPSSSNIIEEESENENEQDDQLLAHKNVFFCSTTGCSKVFTSINNLENHETRGDHKFREKKETLIDYAINRFSEHVETEDSARLKISNDCLSNISPTGTSRKLVEGYGLKKKSTNNKIVDSARAAAEEFFTKFRTMTPPRRACPRTFAQSMVDMKHANGQYVFQVSELLSEKQAQGLFSRWERRRNSTGVTVAKRNSRGVSKTVTSKSRKRRYSTDDESTEPKKIHTVHVTDGNESEEDEGKVEEEDEDEFEFLMNALMEEKDELFLP